MAVLPKGPAPYGPSSALIALVRGYRTKGWSPPFTLDLVTRAGVSSSLAPRVLQTMKLLDLITEDGMPTPAFEGLRRVPEAEFQSALADVLKAAYADVFQFIDPATDSEERMRDAFRTYEPLGQLNRMVSLFTGLCVEAGLRPQESAKSPKPKRTVTVAKRPQQRQQVALPVAPAKAANYGSSDVAGLPAAVNGMLADLPKNREWTADQRDKWVKMFSLVIDYSYAVVTAVAATDDDEELEKLIGV